MNITKTETGFLIDLSTVRKLFGQTGTVTTGFHGLPDNTRTLKFEEWTKPEIALTTEDVSVPVKITISGGGRHDWIQRLKLEGEELVPVAQPRVHSNEPSLFNIERVENGYNFNFTTNLEAVNCAEGQVRIDFEHEKAIRYQTVKNENEHTIFIGDEELKPGDRLQLLLRIGNTDTIQLLEIGEEELTPLTGTFDGRNVYESYMSAQN